MGSPQTSNLAFLAEFCVVLQMKSTIASPYRLLSMGIVCVTCTYVKEMKSNIEALLLEFLRSIALHRLQL